MRGRGHADPLSLALRSAYGPKVPLSWDPAIMLSTIIGDSYRIIDTGNHAHSRAIYLESRVTRNTFIAHVCYRFYAVRHRQGGTRCGSLRSTSPAASSRTTWILAADRSSTSARAFSAGARRSCAIRARPDRLLEVCSARHQDPDQTRLDASQHFGHS